MRSLYTLIAILAANASANAATYKCAIEKNGEVVGIREVISEKNGSTFTNSDDLRFLLELEIKNDFIRKLELTDKDRGLSVYSLDEWATDDIRSIGLRQGTDKIEGSCWRFETHGNTYPAYAVDL